MLICVVSPFHQIFISFEPVKCVTFNAIAYIFFLECHYVIHEVPEMILLRDLKGAMRLDLSEDMSVHVSTCTSYDFSALTPVVWKLWR